MCAAHMAAGLSASTSRAWRPARRRASKRRRQQAKAESPAVQEFIDAAVCWSRV
jgi:hypothetical protein